MMQPEGAEAIRAVAESVASTGNGTLVTSIVSGLLALVVGLVGWFIKRQRSSNALEDASHDITVETLASARQHIKDQDMQISNLQAQVRDMLKEVQQASIAQLESEGIARRAAVQAGLADEASTRASEAAQRAREEAVEARRLLTIQQVYVRQLRSAMIAVGLEPPPEPTS